MSWLTTASGTPGPLAPLLIPDLLSRAVTSPEAALWLAGLGATGILLSESIRYRTIQWQDATFSFGLF